MSPSQRWYRMSGTRAPWGDYGRILLSGMTAHQERTPEGLLRLERTGPFVPPVSMPGLGDLLVTNAFRARLEESPLAGLGFRPVEKTRIVRLEWEHWDQDDFEPEEYPDSGEPEDYILSRPHDPELAARIGPVWEVVLSGRGQAAEADLVRDTPATLHIYASQRARDWLEGNAGTWLRFEDLPGTGGLLYASGTRRASLDSRYGAFAIRLSTRPSAQINLICTRTLGQQAKDRRRAERRILSVRDSGIVTALDMEAACPSKQRLPHPALAR